MDVVKLASQVADGLRPRADLQGVAIIVEEPAERFVVGSVRPKCLEAIDHHEGRAALPEQFDELGQHLGESPAVQAVAEVFVVDVCSDYRLVEETERLAVAEDLLERLGNRRKVEGGTLGRRVMEEVLLGQDRLARARTPHDEVDPVDEKPTVKDRVQARRAARQPVAHWTRTDRRK